MRSGLPEEMSHVKTGQVKNSCVKRIWASYSPKIAVNSSSSKRLSEAHPIAVCFVDEGQCLIDARRCSALWRMVYLCHMQLANKTHVWPDRTVLSFALKCRIHCFHAKG